MSNAILVIGDSGTGKSTSIKSLPPDKTFIVNCIGKDLPFKGWKSKYTKQEKGVKGNYFASDKPVMIMKMLNYINEERPEIEYIVIDDFIYTMSNEFMARANEKSFDKFTDIGKNAWAIFNKAKSLRDGLNVAILTHSEEYMDASGVRKQKIKTVGKLVDNVVNLEGMCTTVLYTDVKHSQEGTKYGFLTRNTGFNTGKSPDEMFEEEFIPNDLKYVFDKIDEYNL